MTVYIIISCSQHCGFKPWNVATPLILGVYYVRVVQWIYFPNYGDLIWQKILKKLKGVNLRKSVILGVVLFMVLFLMISPALKNNKALKNA